MDIRKTNRTNKAIFGGRWLNGEVKSLLGLIYHLVLIDILVFNAIKEEHIIKSDRQMLYL